MCILMCISMCILRYFLLCFALINHALWKRTRLQRAERDVVKFGVSGEQITTVAQGFAHFAHRGSHGLAPKIDENVATQNQVDVENPVFARWKSVAAQVAVMKSHHFADARIEHEIFAARLEITLNHMVRRVAKRPRAVNGVARPIKGGFAEIGADNANLPVAAKRQQLIECYRQGISLFARRAARAPHAQGAARAIALEKLRQNRFAQQSELSVIAEKVAFLIGEQGEKLFPFGDVG